MDAHRTRDAQGEGGGVDREAGSVDREAGSVDREGGGVDLQPPRRPVGVYRIDPAASRVEVRGRALGIVPVRCAFDEVSGSLRLTDDVRVSTVEVRARSASVRAAGPAAGALRSAPFLDAEQHPEIVFRGDRVERVGADTYLLRGLLEVRGATRPKTFAVRHRDVAVQDGRARVRLTASGEVDRRAFGVPRSERTVLWGAAVSATVRVRAVIEAVLAAA